MAGQVDLHVEEREGGAVARLTVAHDAKLNTLNPQLMQELILKADGLAARTDLRAVVLTGEGSRAFIGGADIRTMAEIQDGPAAERFIELVHRSCHVFRDLPVPVIARINGFTLGAGLEVAASCDLRIAAESARFGMPEVLVGIPSVVEAALLPGLIGWGRTRRLLLLGETIGAAEALEWGLVERVVPDSDLDAAVEEWIGRLLHAAPQAVRIQKRLIRQWEDLPLKEAVAAGIPAFASAWTTEEPRERMRGFLESQAARKRSG
ncbi:MAG TPA: enoyl-CoA hydratase [Acetobacteraceae bacterium]|nr:enoyl-CoA hydratase [Acetobacteraceae bacterium]